MKNNIEIYISTGGIKIVDAVGGEKSWSWTSKNTTSRVQSLVQIQEKNDGSKRAGNQTYFSEHRREESSTQIARPIETSVTNDKKFYYEIQCPHFDLFGYPRVGVKYILADMVWGPIPQNSLKRFKIAYDPSRWVLNTAPHLGAMLASFRGNSI